MSLFDSQRSLDKERRRTGRRRFLYFCGSGAGLYWGYRLWRDRARPLISQRTRYISPDGRFYRVSIRPGFRPDSNLEHWNLTFSNDADVGFSLDYEALHALDSKRLPKTFMCIENPVGGNAIGNAEWTVTPLAPLLEKLFEGEEAGLRVVFRSLDGFYSSVPLDTALDEEAYLAYEMNGRQLPPAHGFPVRVLLPSKYGMKQPKWLERIEVTSALTRGYWENRGWSYDCDVRMTGRIDSSVRQANGVFKVTGIAYCGGDPVGRVEFSGDDRKTWQDADLTSLALPNAWTTWTAEWRPSRLGEHILSVRVASITGARQTESYTGSFPAGSTGLHRVIIEV